MKTASSIMLGLGGVFFVVGWAMIFNSGYSNPSIPAGSVFAFLLMVVGSATVVSGISLSLHKAVHIKHPHIFQGIIGCLILALGIRTFVLHPLELPNCSCLTGYFGGNCDPCDCLNGICDDGGEGSGICSCDLGWAGTRCDTCATTFTDDCTVCKRGWTGAACDTCYPGYSGSSCNVCDTNWITESDDLGTLCRTCKEGYYGGYCKSCRACNAHDNLAICRDNTWHSANIYTGDTCTSTGQVCTNNYECGSFNCKGLCVDGDETSGEICESDLECSFGTCQYRTCCGEKRYGNGECECARTGYWGPSCDACPGFDGVYSASVCGGHGTCAAAYSGSGDDEAFNKLQCVCNPQGTEPFPTWSGNTCGCLKETTDAKCSSCADGYFGEECNNCPGGGGISQCSMHGECNDGIDGTGTCSCDIDIKPNGLGGWGGEQCSNCFSSDFYGDRCSVCPSTIAVQCGDGRAEIPGTGVCINSCGTQTCSTTGSCD